MTTPLFTQDQDWTEQLILNTQEVIEKIGREELHLDTYPNQIEILNAEGMIDAYSSISMPIYYRHWSLGKSFISNQKKYQVGYMGLAYEVVLNSNPTITYLMDSNTMTMQALVLAHATQGHNAVFKNNYLFKTWTDAGGILNYLSFAKHYIKSCEEKYGELVVEEWLDHCHALFNHGVDNYKRKPKKKRTKEDIKKIRMDEEISLYDELWESTIRKKKLVIEGNEDGALEKPEENILYFIEKNAPSLPAWKRELIHIVRKISQYFMPQSMTKVLNEGFACFTHYFIMDNMYKKRLLTDGSWLEFIINHTNVMMQQDFTKTTELNPYALGYNIFRDIKRICENPTKEDLKYLPHLKGKNWIDATQEAMREYSDAGFISQYLSPKVIRDMRLFMIHEQPDKNFWPVTAIHNEHGYTKIRDLLSEYYSRSFRVPTLEIVNVDLKGDRKLTISYTPYRDRSLDVDLKKETLYHLEKLWEYPIEILEPPTSEPDLLEMPDG